MTFEELMSAFHKNDFLNNTIVYEKLLEQLKNDRVTPVIGAGLSVWADYPLWGNLIEKLANETDCKDKVIDCLSKKKYEEAASLLEDFYGHNYLMGILTREFSPEKLKKNKESRRPYQKLLPKLFKGPFVTTNFDVSLEGLLESTLVVDPKNTFYENETESRLQTHKRILIKLHGTVDDPQHMVFTKESYDSAYGEDEYDPDENKPLPQQLKTIFQSSPPLFLGCSLGSDRTCRVFEKCKGTMGFALLGMPETEEEFKKKRQEMDKMQIEVIWYPHEKHEAVAVLINQLAEDMKIQKNS